MIISDTPNHKVDVEKVEQAGMLAPWIQLTVFHRKGEEWTTKIVRLSPEAADKLCMFLQVDCGNS